jgi:hypothetical protein
MRWVSECAAVAATARVWGLAVRLLQFERPSSQNELHYGFNQASTVLS